MFNSTIGTVIPMRRFTRAGFMRSVIFSVLAITAWILPFHFVQAVAGDTMNKGTASPLPRIGLYAYTHAHAQNQNPPDRWGGPVTIVARQKKGAAQ